MGIQLSQLAAGGGVLGLTLLSGLLDGKGFVYAARAWPGGQFDVKMGSASVFAFMAGLACYVLAVKYLQQLGVASVALQSGLWFVVTSIGIAAMDGRIVEWTRTQQIVAVLVATGLGWLIASTTASQHS